MKTFALSLIVCILFFTACKKQTTPQPAAKPKTYLLSKTTYVVAGLTNVYTFSYDSKNRLTQLNSAYTSTIFKFTYDDNNNLLTAGLYDYSNQLDAIYKFSYTGNTVTVGFYTSGGTSLLLTYTLTLNASGYVTTISGFDQPATYNYDADSNITETKEDGGGVVYATFDDKKNPLSMTGAKNYYLMYFFNEISLYPSTFVNNELSIDQDTYTYTYNADGFPTVKTTVNNKAYQTFEYIVK